MGTLEIVDLKLPFAKDLGSAAERTIPHLFDDFRHLSIVECLFPVFLFGDQTLGNIRENLLNLQDLREIRLSGPLEAVLYCLPTRLSETRIPCSCSMQSGCKELDNVDRGRPTSKRFPPFFMRTMETFVSLSSAWEREI